MRVVALGRTDMLYNSILQLSKNGHKIIFIGTCKEGPEYRKTSEDFKQLSENLDVDYKFFSKPNNINSEQFKKYLRNKSPDIAISINWKTRIDGEVIDCFQYGIINAHIGDLPRYRGNATPNWAIISGETEVVLTLHLMSDKLDTGPILLKEKFPISYETYIKDVYDVAEQKFPVMFVDAINGLETGTIIPKQQPSNCSKSLYCYPRLPQDGLIDWKRPAVEIHRLIRAVSHPFAGAYTYLGTQKFIIWKAYHEKALSPFLSVPGQVIEIRRETGEVAIATGDGILILEEVETEKKGIKKPSKIIKSIRKRLGMNITGEIERLNKRIIELERNLRDISEL